MFTAAINSQCSKHARYDWRRQGLALIDAWQPYNLPQEIEEKLLQLMAYFGLNYEAIDLILTPDQRHIFIEVNPVGEFFLVRTVSWLTDLRCDRAHFYSLNSKKL